MFHAPMAVRNISCCAWLQYQLCSRHRLIFPFETLRTVAVSPCGPSGQRQQVSAPDPSRRHTVTAAQPVPTSASQVGLTKLCPGLFCLLLCPGKERNTPWKRVAMAARPGRCRMPQVPIYRPQGRVRAGAATRVNAVLVLAVEMPVPAFRNTHYMQNRKVQG